MSQVTIRRSEWRAELCEYAAATLHEAGLFDMAEEQTQLAGYHRQEAELLQELDDAKAGDDPEKLKNTKLLISSFRRASRSQGTAQPGILNNFTEPSNDELMNGA